MAVFSLFFGHLANIPSDEIPYPVFAFAGLVLWTFVATAVPSAANSLVEHEQLVSNVYFPRLIMPAAAVGASLVDFAIAFLVLLGMVVAYGFTPGWALLSAPLFVALAVLTALGISFWLAALNVQFRDVRYTLPFIVQLWLFVSPIAYPSSIVPNKWKVLYAVNPMVGAIDGFRWALLNGPAPGRMIVVSTCLALVITCGGLMYFRRTERAFADIV
jgi:lipopolysaccharide transport system permease protein